MKDLQQRIYVHGKIIVKYKISKAHIQDLNKKYEIHKDKLDSFGKRLAGRLESELNILSFFEKTTAFQPIIHCMGNYVEECKKFGLMNGGTYNLDILSCWMNDMKEGEYNPPHIHHDNIGYSSVLYLKVPKFINDATEPHKFKDGEIGFIGVDGNIISYMSPKVGDLYIFKADHQHCVLPFKTKKPGETRRSMSFNFVAEPHEKK
jgi:hypothetical protein|tara:strand:- start:86 stop:700 length:615 start_codon:yes stop_codon:yes gene_type:complete